MHLHINAGGWCAVYHHPVDGWLWIRQPKTLSPMEDTWMSRQSIWMLQQRPSKSKGIQHRKLRPAPSGQMKLNNCLWQNINTTNWRSKVSTTARQSLTYPTKLTIDRLTIVHRLPAHGAVTTTSEHLLDRSHLSDRLYVSISVSHGCVQQLNISG